MQSAAQSAESVDPIANVDPIGNADPIGKVGPTRIVCRNAIAGAVLLLAADAVAATDQNSNSAWKPGEGMNGSPFV